MFLVLNILKKKGNMIVFFWIGDRGKQRAVCMKRGLCSAEHGLFGVKIYNPRMLGNEQRTKHLALVWEKAISFQQTRSVLFVTRNKLIQS